jgi:hypothetical protein
MQSAIFDTPVIKVKTLETKFDTIVLSNSFIALLGDCNEARILQQLHYWCYSQYGVVIDGIRWIYKPYREWLSEALTGITSWKLRVAISSLLEKGLIKREKLYVKHHEIKHDNPYWHPKNQTYYYSVNYDKLQKLISEVENPETIETVRVVSATMLSVVDCSDTKSCELSQNKTDITSIKNNSKYKSHPTLPSECETVEDCNQNKQEKSKPVLSKVLERPDKTKINIAKSSVVEKETIPAGVEEKINQYNSTKKQDNVPEPVQVESVKPKPKPKTPKGTKPERKDNAPWKDEGQFKRFYRELIQALPIVANSHSPAGLAQTIIRQLRCGIPHSYWDDFINGLPIGSSTKPEWEIEPGVPYPMFVEYLTEKIKPGDNSKSDEQTRNEVFRILAQPRQAKSFWGQFKRNVVNVSEQVERDRSLGVINPATPVWSLERIEPSLEEAAAAGEKIMAVNDTPSLPLPHSPTPPDPWTNDESEPEPKVNLKELLVKHLGDRASRFIKQMPQVSPKEVATEERRQIKPKTNIDRMSISEINDYLADPILRKQLTPQLMKSDYELITNEYGEIIAVRRSIS